MSTVVNREDLLRTLQAVQPGVSPKGTVDQCSCLAFVNGSVVTFNGEVYCRARSPLPDIRGAVEGKPLIDILAKYPDQDIEVEQSNGHLTVRGKNRRSGVRMEKDILMPIDEIERPAKGDWQDLSPEFSEAVDLVYRCAQKEGANSVAKLTHVHVRPDLLESCDRSQIARYRIETPVSVKVLVRRESVKHAAALGVTRIAETAAWVHFRNPDGHTVGCKRWAEEYVELDPLCEFEGEPAKLPAGLVEAVQMAEVFSQENGDDQDILVDIRPGRVTVKGQGVTGWHEEVKRMAYDGPHLRFYAPPKVLAELCSKHADCTVTPTKLKVVSGKFTYVCCLTAADQEK